MKIISWNVNGLRSNYEKGFLDKLKQFNADIVCLQETRLNLKDLPFEVKDYEFYLNPAIKPGYSGTGIFTKIKPNKIITKIGMKRFDNEGRMLHLKYDNFDVINFYIPNGGRTKENLEYKLESYKKILKYLSKLNNAIVVGDFNIAHTEIDLARPKENKNNIMFTSAEREQITKLIKLGYVDSFREFIKEGECYSWWAYYRKLRERNIGWRIDYVFTKNIKLKDAFILDQVFGSDHAPIGIDARIT